MSEALAKGRVAFFGRFQPFHKGHLEALKWLLGRYREVVVLIGMATESYTFRNPFTAGERVLMIREASREAGLDLSRIVTVTVPTHEIHVGHMCNILTYCPPIEALATRNPVIAAMCESLGLKVVEPPLVSRHELRGEYIRTLIAKGDPKWRELVPPAVARIIDAIGGVSRLAKLASLQHSSDLRKLLKRESM